MIDYKNFDTLTIQVKTNKKDEVLKYYSALGWQLFDEKDNARFEDLFDLTFIRPHKIANKDELQLEQIHLENKLNALGKLEKYKDAKTISFILLLLPLLLASAGIGLWLVLSYAYLTWLIVGISLEMLALALAVILAIFTGKIHKKEKEYFLKHRDDVQTQINETLEKIKMLQVNNG